MAFSADTVRSFILESMEALPLLLMFLLFFFGIMTSNVGMLIIVLTSILYIPILSSMASRSQPPSTLISLSTLSYILFPFLAFWPISVFAQQNQTLDANDSAQDKSKKMGFSSIGVLVPSLLAILVPFLSKGTISQLGVFNPLRWFSSPPSPPSQCSLLPGASSGTSPSTWIITMMFLYGILMNNAASLYSFPAPTFNSTISSDLQDKVNQKVDTRKKLAITSMAITSLLILLAIAYRTHVLNCDSWTDIPIYAVIAFLGASFYSFLVYTCGVRPVDLFGLITNYLPPEASSRPVVCSVPT